MSVKLRKRKNSDNSTSLVLDIYHDGQRTYEFLKHLKLSKANNPIDRQRNKECLKLAEQIRNKREQQLQSEDYEITPAFKKSIDFTQFFENYLKRYLKKDKRVIVASYHKFLEFMKEEGIKSLTTKQITESLAEKFKDYLEENLNGVTPANYFKKFKKVLSQGVTDKVLSSNPAQNLTAKRNDTIKKDILTIPEIRLLAQAKCSNDEVKRAFLFSCLSGLRFCDVKSLTWYNINKEVLKITQQKTGKNVIINLNNDAMQILGKPLKSDVKVFNLPSHTGCLKILKKWCENAVITKKITWHCARHSFATNLVQYGSDVNTASSLLGHSSLAYTQQYLRIVESLKERAVSNLPSLELSTLSK
ncbi:MAG TPA: site-specific integrase [Bacteroidia bacterium]|jgi:integrase/recombinase XerD|nr:site-specific integrase [Bacteroidia bacterium]